MKYDILPSALWEVNTSIGNKSLTYSELVSMTDYSSINSVALVGSDILVLDFDFGYRIALDRVEYKFSSSSFSDSLVASGINFSYREEIFGDYIDLDTRVLSSGIFSTEALDDFAPRFLRITHTLDSVVTVSGTLYGCKAYNDDSFVNFGSDGSKTDETISVVRDIADTTAIAIYNNNDIKADAYVNLEPTYSNLDEAVSISLSSSGPWTKALDNGDLIVDGTNFDYGVHNDTEITGNTLRVAPAETSGYYTTKIVKKTSDYCRFLINKDTTVSGLIAVDSTDPVETIYIRSSEYAPVPYAVYRQLYWDNTGLKYRDKWLVTDETKETSTGYLLTISDGSYYSIINYMLVCNNVSEFFAGFCSFTATSNRQGRVYLINASSESFSLAQNTAGNAAVSFVGYDFKLDTDNGMWAYFYSESYSASHFVDVTGYYLVYFDSDLSNIFKWHSTAKEIEDMAVDFDTKHIWYTKTGGEICKTYIDGTVEVIYDDDDYVEDLGGIALLSNGNVIFASDNDLYIISDEGLLLTSFTDVAVDKIIKIEPDPNDDSAVWVIDSSYVARFFISGSRAGSYDFKVEFFYPVYITPTEDGVWVRCSDLSEEGTGTVTAKMRYVSKQNRVTDYTYNMSGMFTPCLFYQTYENINYTSKLPISHDTNWSSLGWDKVSVSGYLGFDENYYQLKINMYRADTGDVSSDTPVINSIYRQSLLNVGEIYPGNSKNVYVKTYVSDSLDVDSGLDIDMKVRWKVADN